MWYACAIAVDAWFNGRPWETPIELSNEIRLESLPDWVKDDEAIKNLSWSQRDQIKEASWVLATEYEADALGSPDPDWKGSAPRAIQETVNEKFFLASVALWVAKPSQLTYGPVIHFGRLGDSESHRQSSTLNRILIRDDEVDNVPTTEDFQVAGRYLNSFLSLERESTIWVAVRMLSRGLTEQMWEGRYLWHWIVLEALFGPDNPQETTHRLAQRIAVFLDEDLDKRKEYFRRVKEAYGWRSKLVHGAKIAKLTSEKSRDLTVFTEDTVRRAFSKILDTAALITTLSGKGRDQYLEEMVLGCRMKE